MRASGSTRCRAKYSRWYLQQRTTPRSSFRLWAVGCGLWAVGNALTSSETLEKRSRGRTSLRAAFLKSVYIRTSRRLEPADGEHAAVYRRVCIKAEPPRGTVQQP